MVIYADILVLSNLYIDFLLLYCVKKFLHLRIATSRIIIGAVVGALTSITALFPQFPNGIVLFIGIAAAFLTTAAAFLPVKPLMYLKTAAAFWAFSFLFAGFFMFIVHFFAPKNLVVNNNAVYFNLSPALLFGSTIAAYIAFVLYRKFFPQRDGDILFCKIIVEGNGKKAELLAKADTGNSLTEPFSGLAVIVAESEALKGVAPEAAIKFLEGDISNQAETGFRLVPFEGLGGTGLLPAFKPETIGFAGYENVKECYIALYPKKLSAGQFNALFNPSVIIENSS